MRWQEYDLYSRQITDKIVSKFLEKYPSPKNGIEIINERLDTIVNANGHSLPRFFEALSRLKPEYSITMCEQILEQGDCLLAPHIDSILYQARVFDLERAVQIVHNAVDSNISSLCEPFARTYWAWDKDIPLDQLEALIHKLLAHSELKVKKATIGSLGLLKSSQPELALSLALNIEIAQNTELAEKLFEFFYPATFKELTDQELKKFLKKLKYIDNLDNHSIKEFLIYTSQKIPSSLFEFILKRIELSWEKNDRNYEPLPSDYYENVLCYLSSAQDYESMLRRIRDLWLDNALKFNCHLRSLYEKFYKEISFTVINKTPQTTSFDITPISINLLNEWINSNDAEKIIASSRLIQSFHSGFIFQHLDFIENLLERAYDADDQCYQTVIYELSPLATPVIRMGILGELSSQDIELALEMAKQSDSYPVQNFFKFLAKCTQSDIDFFQENFE